MMNSKQTFFSLLMCVLAIAGCDTQKQAIVGNELALTQANIGFFIPELFRFRYMPVT